MATNKLHARVSEMVAEFPMKIVVYGEPEGGFSIQAPRLATCFASGDTLSQALRNFKFAIFDYYDIPMAKQDPNLVSYKFIDLPEPNTEVEEEFAEVDVNIRQLVGC